MWFMFLFIALYSLYSFNVARLYALFVTIIEIGITYSGGAENIEMKMYNLKDKEK